MIRRLLSYFAFALGLIATTACIAVIVALGSLHMRARQSIDVVFDRIDGALAVVQERAEQTAVRARESAITTRGIAQGLRQWTGQQAKQQLVERLEVEENSDRLRMALSQADYWLEASQSSAGLVQEAVSIANSFGAELETMPVDGLVDEIDSLRSELDKARQVIDELHQRIAGDQEVSGERIEQAVELSLRVAATLTAIDDRLDQVAAQMSQVQEKARRVRGTLLASIRLATFVVAVVLAWIAAGQAALCILAWRGARRATI